MAIEQFRTALSLKPDFPKAHYNLGLGYLGKGSKDMARTEFELELSVNPNDYAAQEALDSLISDTNK